MCAPPHLATPAWPEAALPLLQFSEDPDAYGMKEPANPPPLRTSSGLSSMDSYTSEDSTSCSEADGDETVSYLGSRQGLGMHTAAYAGQSASHICAAAVPSAQAGPSAHAPAYTLQLMVKEVHALCCLLCAQGDASTAGSPSALGGEFPAG